MTDEIHQFYVLGRISSTFDIAIDSFGAIAMQCVINIYEWLKEQNH
ncbi:VanZ family protein [Candidatus Woesearchaeota archaeon]|nr:VanZ family protein [Candidatus Woesearchaeota archaeon]